MSSLYHVYHKSNQVDQLAIQRKYSNRYTAASLLRHLLKRTRQLEFGTPWFWWIVQTMRAAWKEFTCTIASDDTTAITWLFVNRLRLDKAHARRLEQTTFLIIEHAAAAAANDTANTPSSQIELYIDALDMAIFQCHAMTNSATFPWLALIRIAGSFGNAVTLRNREDAYHVMEAHANRLLDFSQAHNVPGDMLPMILTCLLRYHPTVAMVVVANRIIQYTHDVTRAELLRNHTHILYWMSVHALLATDAIDLYGCADIMMFVSRLAIFLASRRIYLLRFGWHRITEILVQCKARGAYRHVLQCAVLQTLDDPDTIESKRYFVQMQDKSPELVAWQQLFGGPDMFEHMVIGPAKLATGTVTTPIPECILSANLVYQEAYLSSSTPGNRPPPIDMESLIRHMAMTGDVDPLTNLPLDSAVMSRLNPCFGEKMSDGL